VICFDVDDRAGYFSSGIMAICSGSFIKFLKFSKEK